MFNELKINRTDKIIILILILFTLIVAIYGFLTNGLIIGSVIGLAYFLISIMIFVTWKFFKVVKSSIESINKENKKDS